MGQISLDFSGAISKSDQIANCGKAIKKQADLMKDYENSIGKSWKGDSSKKYIVTYDKYVVKLKNHGDSLKTNAEALKKSAKKLRDAEEIGKALFGWL